MTSIREATTEDIEAIAALHSAGWREGFAGIVPPELTPSPEELAQRLRERFADPSRGRAVAEREGQLVGFCIFGPSRDEGAEPGVGEIYVLFVSPSSWRRGVGRALVEHALAESSRTGFREVTLWSAAENSRANAFYERLGFVLDGAEQFRHEFGDVREIRYRRVRDPAALIPPRVSQGDTVAVLSPSLGGVGLWPHRVDRARTYLESLGLRVKVMPNASSIEGWVSASAERRAEDIHGAFLDDDVSVVLAAIGGLHSNQLLPHLDFELIRSHPKVFQGYSDVTVLLWAIAKHAGLRTFHGPALIPELGEYPRVLGYTDRVLRAAWFGAEPIDFEPAEAWTDELLDWNEKADLERARQLSPSEGWITIREGIAEGPLLGGCLESICWQLKGSRSWIEPDGAVFFVETADEARTPAYVDAYLTDLEQLGVFDRAAALVVGRPYQYDDRSREALWRVVRERTESAGIPVLGNVELGHTDPMLTLPLGARAQLDASQRQLGLLEAPTV